MLLRSIDQLPKQNVRDRDFRLFKLEERTYALAVNIGGSTRKFEYSARGHWFDITLDFGLEDGWMDLGTAIRKTLSRRDYGVLVITVFLEDDYADDELDIRVDTEAEIQSAVDRGTYQLVKTWDKLKCGDLIDFVSKYR